MVTSSLALNVALLGGYLLGKPFAAVRQVPEYPTLLRFLGEGALLSLQGERRVSLVARNLPRARLEIGRLRPESLQHLAFLNSGSFDKPQVSYPGEDSLLEREELRLRFDASDPAKAQYEGVDLSRFLAPGRRGIFLLSLRLLGPLSDLMDFSALMQQMETAVKRVRAILQTPGERENAGSSA